MRSCAACSSRIRCGLLSFWFGVVCVSGACRGTHTTWQQLGTNINTSSADIFVGHVIEGRTVSKNKVNVQPTAVTPIIDKPVLQVFRGAILRILLLLSVLAVFRSLAINSTARAQHSQYRTPVLQHSQYSQYSCL